MKSIIHPVVIIDILKEFHNIYKKKFFGKKLGSLLGYCRNKVIFCTSCFRFPHEENSMPICFFDQIYMEKIAMMHRKINSKENVIGWYILKKKVKLSDLDIHSIFFGYTHTPILLHIWASKQLNGLILDVFLKSQQNVSEKLAFKTLSVKIGMLESEQIAINQLLINAKNSPYIAKFNVAKKWHSSVVFFSKFVEKILKFEQNKKLIFDKDFLDPLFVTKIVQIFKKDKTKTLCSIEKRFLILYLFTMIRLTLSIEKLAFRTINIKINK